MKLYDIVILDFIKTKIIIFFKTTTKIYNVVITCKQLVHTPSITYFNSPIANGCFYFN